MGRRRQKDLDLPPRMARKGSAYYYVTAVKPRRWIPLGSDLTKALRSWADLEGKTTTGVTFAEVAKLYREKVYPSKAARTRKDNDAEFKHLEGVFGSMPLESITRKHLGKYHELRGQTAKVRANREISLFSHVWNFARSKASGYLTEAPNPAERFDKFSEEGRDVYVTDEVLLAIAEKSDQALQDAIWLALLTGQRVSDVLAMRREQVRDGFLNIKQGKTGKRLRLDMDSALGRLVNELTTRERKVSGPWLIQIDGQRVNYFRNAKAFQRARSAAAAAYPQLSQEIERVQFRDLRAKAGTEAADERGILQASRLLGHASVTMTERYVRLGDRVEPLK